MCSFVKRLQDEYETRACEHLLWSYCKLYPSQTKIFEGRTNVSECVSPGSTFQRFVGQIQYSQCHTLEKCFPGNALGNVCSAFENLRSGSIHLLQKTASYGIAMLSSFVLIFMLPKRRFSTFERAVWWRFSTHLSRIVSALFWATMHWKVLRKESSNGSFECRKSSFGSLSLYPLPNEDFRHSNQRFRMRFHGKHF